MNAAKVNMLTT